MKLSFRIPFRLIAALFALVLVASACSSDSDTSATTDAGGSDTVDTDDTVDTVDEASEAGDDGGRADPVSGGEDSDAGSSEGGADEAMSEEAMSDEAMSDDVSTGEAAALAPGSEREAADVAEEPFIEAPVPSEPPLEPEPEPSPQPQPRAGLLTAAEVDDNLNFAFFGEYLGRTAQNYGQVLPYPDLSDRVSINVVDSNGAAVANTPITVTKGDTDVARVFSDSSGFAQLFPSFVGVDDWESLELRVAGASATVSAGDESVTITAADAEGGSPQALDVALVLDVTGSMSDELSYLTVEFASIIERLRKSYPDADLRFALVSYRDEGDEFVTKTYEFTSDVATMSEQLSEQRADGGGDYPEAMDAAMAEANALDWREGNVARVMIINADAPPHDQDLNATIGETVRAIDQGIRIYPLAASGVGDTAEYLMRIMGATTGGRHLFLTSDSGIGGAKQEPKTQCYQVTNLDDLLVRVLQSELAGERIEASADSVIREVGNYDRGVCSEQ